MLQPQIVEYVAPQARELGIQQGTQETTRKLILEALSLRLEIDSTQTLKSTLDAIDDLEILESIYRAAIVSETLDDFKHELNELTN